MRPYLAIIIDSFRAALASRVLYIMLALITLLFLVVGPLHLTESLDWRLNSGQHFEDSDAIVSRLIERGETGKSKPTARVWSLLSENTQATVRKLYENKETFNDDRPRGPGGQRRARAQQLSQLVDELNEMIQSPSFYREEDWGRFSVVPEAEVLLADGYGNLSEERMRRVNRLLIGKALPGLASPSAATISIFYWFFNNGGAWTFSTSQQQVATVASSITAFLFDKLLLSVGLLVGIVVTANVMPQMFDPGTLNLLLSKPITRSGLYLTRFAGGCTQIAICAAYLFTGTWLWLGLAIGVWDQAFLWSIPIYVLVFAIYYCVSALVGLLYRSPILAVVATVVFWATCFFVGSTYVSFHAIMQNERLYDPLVTENAAVAVNGFNETVVWDGISKKWSTKAQLPDGPNKDAFEFNRFFLKLKLMPNQIRPTVDLGSEQVVAGVTMPFPPQPGGFARYKGYASDLTAEQFAAVGDFPRYTMTMFSTDKGLLLCDRDGKFKRWDPKSTSRIVAKSVGPDEPAKLLTTFSAAMNNQNQEVAVHEIADGQHRIVFFKATDDGYVRDHSTVIDIGTAEKIKCFIAYANNTVVVVAGNGRIVAVDATSKKPLPPIPASETACGIETIATSPDGKWVAMAYANQRLWLMDVDNDRKLYRPSVTGSNDVSSVSFDANNHLCVFDRENRLTIYDTATMKSTQVIASQDSFFEIGYRYLISPLYTIFPKPSEFHKVTSYLSSTRDTTDNPAVDLIFEPVETNPLLPLWSGLGFMALMLGLSCWIFHRKDF